MKFLTIILILVISSSSWSQEEPRQQERQMERVGRESGGRRVETSSQHVLMKIKTELAKQVRVMPADDLVKYFDVPKEWTPVRIANVIDNLLIDTRPETLKFSDGGSLKTLDFDRKAETITALAGFFLMYSRDLVRGGDMNDIVDDVKRELLYEVSHLWNKGEDTNQKAEEFSKRYYRAVALDTLTCNLTYITPAGTTYVAHNIYELGTGSYSTNKGHRSFDKKVPFPRVMLLGLDQPRREGLSSWGSFKWEVAGDKIVVTSLSGRGDILTVDRRTDEHGVSSGTFSQAMWKQDPVVTDVRCEIANER